MGEGQTRTRQLRNRLSATAASNSAPTTSVITGNIGVGKLPAQRMRESELPSIHRSQYDLHDLTGMDSTDSGILQSYP